MSYLIAGLHVSRIAGLPPGCMAQGGPDGEEPTLVPVASPARCRQMRRRPTAL
jgi:hypothetical protein